MSKRTRSKRDGSFQAKFSPGAALIGSYRPLATPVHRVPLWLKACLFAAFMLLLALTGWQVAFGVCAVCLILAYSAGIKTMELLRMLYAMRWLLILLAFYYALWGGWDLGADVLATLLAATLASRIILTSTPLPVLIDGVVTFCAPLRFVGVRPKRLGLAIGLMIRSIPAIMDRWGTLLKAAAARGLPAKSTWRLITPLVVQTVDYAQKTADALAARGLDE